MKLFDGLDNNEEKAFKLHLFYSSIDGVTKGALLLNEFIFIKSLKGTNVQLAFLFQFSMVVFLFAMLANELLRRYTNRKQLLRIIGVITHLPLIAFAFFPSVGKNGVTHEFHLLFLGIFLLFYTSKIAIVPSINQYLKGNYQHHNFGRLFGYATSVNKVFTMVFTFISGLLLDYNANSYTVFYPFVGVLGVVSIFQLTKMRFIQTYETLDKPLWTTIEDSFRRIFFILKNNRSFRHLEIGFILYGFAWMSTHAVITIFYEKVLELNYSSVAFYNNAYNLVAILVLPLFGRLIGKRDPRRFGIFTFGTLLFFILSIALTEWFNGYSEIFGIKIYFMMLLAVLFNGLFMGSMPLLWGIGSSYFCKADEAADYQSVHLFLTGARALFAPLIGIKLYEWYGFSLTYFAGILLLLCAMLLMVYSEKRFPKS